MEDLFFENDDFFLPNSEEENIWNIVDPILSSTSNGSSLTLEKREESAEPQKRALPKPVNSPIPPNKKSKQEIEVPSFESKSDEVLFFSNENNPFAQSSWMVLLEKKIPFKYIEIPNKVPEWFLKVNAEGTVPALKYEDTVIHDSYIINEFLEDCFDSKTNMLPTNPCEKAKARLVIKKIQELIPLFLEFLHSQTMETQKYKGQALKNKLKELNKYLQENHPSSINGPYLLGNDFSLPDCILLPFYERMANALPKIRNWKIPSTIEFDLLQNWFFRASKRLSFQETRNKNSKYEDVLLEGYLTESTNF